MNISDYNMEEQKLYAFLELNYLVAKEFYPEVSNKDFFEKWHDEFASFVNVRLSGQFQLNFPGISINRLASKYSEMTVRLKGTGEKPEPMRNYYPDFFSEDYLNEVSASDDWVTMVVDNPSAGPNDDPSLFGTGMAYDDISELSESLITKMSAEHSDFRFSCGNARSRIIHSLLYMQNRLCVKENHSFGKYVNMRFWAIQLLINNRSADGKVPYAFMDGGGGACFGYDSGGGNSVYGFSLIAEKDGAVSGCS